MSKDELLNIGGWQKIDWKLEGNYTFFETRKIEEISEIKEEIVEKIVSDSEFFQVMTSLK